jgi:hypothetical protein
MYHVLPTSSFNSEAFEKFRNTEHFMVNGSYLNMEAGGSSLGNSQVPSSICGACFLHPQPEDVSCSGDEGNTYQKVYKMLDTAYIVDKWVL